jgi:hypothetical protein
MVTGGSLPSWGQNGDADSTRDVPGQYGAIEVITWPSGSVARACAIASAGVTACTSITAAAAVVSP